MREVSTSNFGRRQFLAGVAAGVGTVALSSPLRAAANEEVRIAVLGAGGRGGELARTVDSVSGAKLVAVADPDEKRAASMAKKYGAKAYTDLREALDSDDVDAVVITTCNHWHCLAALWAIDAGKDVYVEKPLSHSQWEGRQLSKPRRSPARSSNWEPNSAAIPFKWKLASSCTMRKDSAQSNMSKPIGSAFAGQSANATNHWRSQVK